MLDLKNKCDAHQRELDRKDAELKKLKDEVEEKTKLTKEVSGESTCVKLSDIMYAKFQLTLKTKRVAELQKKLKEAEDEIGSLDRETQEKIKKLEATVSNYSVILTLHLIFFCSYKTRRRRAKRKLSRKINYLRKKIN